MKRIISLLTIVLLSLTSCSDKRENALADLEALTEELTSGTESYTGEDWEIAKDQFGTICEELEQYEYTDEELNRIGKLKGRCIAIFAKVAVSDFKKSLHRIGTEAEGFIDGLLGEFEHEEDD